MNIKQIAENLNAVRKERKMTFEKIGERSGLHYQTVYRNLKNGVHSVDILLKLCEALGCEPGDILSNNIDLSAYSVDEDIVNFYPYNLALDVMIGYTRPQNRERKRREHHDEVYKVYVPALMDAIGKLTEREQEVLELRFKHLMTYEQCGRRLCVTRERVRQVEKKALRKLMHPSFRKTYLLDTLSKAFEVAAEKAKVERENMALRQQLSDMGVRFAPETGTAETPVGIENMELSVRSFNCLRRAGIRTVQDLRGMTVQRLKGVRNLGRRSLEEVIAKARLFGIEIENEERIG